MNKDLLRRAVMTTFGVLVTGIAVGMFKNAALGVDPFQVLSWGVFYAIRRLLPNLAYGTYYIVLSAVMFIVVLLVNRRKIGLGTFINMFLLGYVIDWAERFFRANLPVETIPARLLMFAAALFVACFASSCYMVADMGVSVYDAFAITWSERSTVPFRLCRIVTDVLCVVIGSLLCVVGGGELRVLLNFGTVITALCMGPIIAFFNRTVWEPVRYGRSRA